MIPPSFQYKQVFAQVMGYRDFTMERYFVLQQYETYSDLGLNPNAPQSITLNLIFISDCAVLESIWV